MSVMELTAGLTWKFKSLDLKDQRTESPAASCSFRRDEIRVKPTTPLTISRWWNGIVGNDKDEHVEGVVVRVDFSFKMTKQVNMEKRDLTTTSPRQVFLLYSVFIDWWAVLCFCFLLLHIHLLLWCWIYLFFHLVLTKPSVVRSSSRVLIAPSSDQTQLDVRGKESGVRSEREKQNLRKDAYCTANSEMNWMRYSLVDNIFQLKHIPVYTQYIQIDSHFFSAVYLFLFCCKLCLLCWCPHACNFFLLSLAFF